MGDEEITDLKKQVADAESLSIYSIMLEGLHTGCVVLEHVLQIFSNICSQICQNEVQVHADTTNITNMDQTFGTYLVRAAQFYEYKLSHSPDKACESFFGFNSVLPGAYCMFRW